MELAVSSTWLHKFSISSHSLVLMDLCLLPRLVAKENYLCFYLSFRSVHALSHFLLHIVLLSSRGTRTRECLRWQGPAATVNDRPILSSKRAPHINKPTIDSNKNLVLSPRWVLDSKTDWPTDRRS
jgi:hypothetical protein